jgi:hypothetical protein
MRQKAITTVGGLLLVAMTGVSSIDAAAADDLGTATCVGEETTTYHPGLILTEREVRLEGDVTLTCASTHAGIRSAEIHTRNRLTTSCLQILNPSVGEYTIEWNTGEESTVAFQGRSEQLAGQQITTQSGFVTEGLFEEHEVVRVVVGPAINLLDCLSEPGITERHSVNTIEIAPL